ncbi:MAG: hypothetical protein ACO1QR_16110 [Chthoniobacteraceae bacterium]
MTFRRYILPGVLGMIAGILAASFASPDRDADPLATSTLLQPHAGAAYNAETEAGRLAFPGDDGRIARAFSALQQPVRLFLRYEMAEALKDLKPQEFPALVRHVDSLHGRARDELFEPLVERWFEIDPGAARAWAQESPREWKIMQAWGRADPEGAYQTAIQSDKPWAASLLAAIIRADAGDDTLTQLEKVRSLPPGSLRDRPLSSLIVALAGQDPAAAYGALEELPTGNLREQTRYDVLMQWAGKDPAGALAVLKQRLSSKETGTMGDFQVTMVAQRIGRENPELVLEWLADLPAAVRSPASIAAAIAWAENEPLSALGWCMENGIEVARPRYLGEGWQLPVLDVAMRKSPTETLALLDALPPGADRDRLLECAFVASLSELKGDGFTGPGWALYQQLSEEAQIETAESFGAARATQGDLQDLGAWAQNLPAGEARSYGVTGAVKAASVRDPVYGKALLDSLKTPADRDAGLRGIIPTTPPAAAAPLALEISDSQMRKDALEGIVTVWLKKEPVAAREWVNGATTVPTPWKQEWLQNR